MKCVIVPKSTVTGFKRTKTTQWIGQAGPEQNQLAHNKPQQRSAFEFRSIAIISNQIFLEYNQSTIHHENVYTREYSVDS